MRARPVLHRPPSVVSTVDEELQDNGHGVAEIHNDRSSLVSPLLSLSSSSVLRHSRSAVPLTSSASSTTRVHPLMIGIPVVAVSRSIRSQAEGYSSFKAVRGLHADQPRGGMCSLETTESTSTKLVVHLLRRRRHLHLHTRPLDRQAQQHNWTTSCLHQHPHPDVQHDDRGERVLVQHRWREAHRSGTGAGKGLRASSPRSRSRRPYGRRIESPLSPGLGSHFRAASPALSTLPGGCGDGSCSASTSTSSPRVAK